MDSETYVNLSQEDQLVYTHIGEKGMHSICNTAFQTSEKLARLDKIEIGSQKYESLAKNTAREFISETAKHITGTLKDHPRATFVYLTPPDDKIIEDLANGKTDITSRIFTTESPRKKPRRQWRRNR